MELNDVLFSIDEQNIVATLAKARKSLQPEREIILDLSSFRRMHPRDLRALQQLAHQAEDIKSKVVLRGVSVDVYKALKLTQLTRVFSFVN